MTLSPVLRALPGLALAALLLPPPARAAEPDLSPIARLDLPRYMGTWHEVARYPNRFQRDCARDTRATYTLLPQGTVEVRNQCQRADGSVNVAVGEARRVGEAPDGAQLQVRFAPAWLSALPWVWGDYRVLDLDPDYTLAAVGAPGGYLWVLSRTPQVEPARYQALLERLAARGLDPQRLVTDAPPAPAP